MASNFVFQGELQTNNQHLVVKKTEIGAELDLKSSAYAEQVKQPKNEES